MTQRNTQVSDGDDDVWRITATPAMDTNGDEKVKFCYRVRDEAGLKVRRGVIDGSSCTEYTTVNSPADVNRHHCSSHDECDSVDVGSTYLVALAVLKPVLSSPTPEVMCNTYTSNYIIELSCDEDLPSLAANGCGDVGAGSCSVANGGPYCAYDCFADAHLIGLSVPDCLDLTQLYAEPVCQEQISYDPWCGRRAWDFKCAGEAIGRYAPIVYALGCP